MRYDYIAELDDRIVCEIRERILFNVSKNTAKFANFTTSSDRSAH